MFGILEDIYIYIYAQNEGTHYFLPKQFLMIILSIEVAFK